MYLFTSLSTKMIKILWHKKWRYNQSKQLRINQLRKYNIDKCKSVIKAIKEKHLNIDYLNNWKTINHLNNWSSLDAFKLALITGNFVFI